MMLRLSVLRRNSLRIIFVTTSTYLVYRFCFGSNNVTQHNTNRKASHKVKQTDDPPLWLTEAPEHNGCPIPQLQMHPPEMEGFFHNVEPLVCCTGNDQNWVYIQNQKVYIRGNETNCNYVDFRRISDYETRKTNHGPLNNGTTIYGDFLKVRCVRGSGDQKTRFRNVYATVKRLQSAVKRSRSKKLPATALKGMNVYMLGFDSISHLTFQRKLPNFYSYLKQHGSVALNKYNIVGDGTPQALIPILTGMTELELPATQRRYSHAKYVNVYPFVWNEFVNASYVTLYGEDAASIGTFTYRLKGFDEQPTDHYMRTFYTVAESEASNHKKFCWGCDSHHAAHFRYVEDFFDSYKDLPKFAFQFHSVYSHGDYNQVQVADSDMIKHVEMMREKGHLNNTMLVVMADHGARFSDIRRSQQGKVEERLPMMSILMPRWFQIEYPDAMENLKRNADVLTSPFDIHATFKSILNFPTVTESKNKERSLSLFTKIPSSRSCVDIGIEPHWCSCLNWETIDIGSSIVRKSVDSLIDTINNATEHQRNLCIPLELKEIESAAVFSANKELLTFKQSKDYDGFVPEFHSKNTEESKFFQIRFWVTPGDKQFEASVKYDTKTDQIKTNLADISHINKFGHLPDCVIDIDYYIIKWCVCRNWRMLIK